MMAPADMITLRDYVDTLFAEFQKAIDKAEKSMGLRLDAMNEFRDAMKDQATRMATRADLCVLQEEVKSLRSLADTAKGRGSAAAFIAVVSLVVSVLIQILGK